MKRKRFSLRKAVALGYCPEEDRAPKVLASGGGSIGEMIVRRARQSGVPVYEDPVLAEALSQVELGREIPPELYRAVAEVMAVLVSLDAEGRQRR